MLLKVSATFWGAASAEMVNRKGSVVQLKGVEVVKREGRVALNGTARTEIEVFYHIYFKKY